jgi:hypothetical protein
MHPPIKPQATTPTTIPPINIPSLDSVFSPDLSVAFVFVAAPDLSFVSSLLEDELPTDGLLSFPESFSVCFDYSSDFLSAAALDSASLSAAALSTCTFFALSSSSFLSRAALCN